MRGTRSSGTKRHPCRIYTYINETTHDDGSELGGHMELKPGTVIIREGAPPLETKHLATLEEQRRSDGDVDAADGALIAVMDCAVGFAAFLHNSTHPMFLHTLRLMLEYQESECAGCRAGTRTMGMMLAARPPSDEESLALLGLDEWGKQTPENMPDNIKERLMTMLRDVQGGTPVDEAMAKIGGHILDHTSDEG